MSSLELCRAFGSFRKYYRWLVIRKMSCGGIWIEGGYRTKKGAQDLKDFLEETGEGPWEGPENIIERFIWNQSGRPMRSVWYENIWGSQGQGQGQAKMGVA